MKTKDFLEYETPIIEVLNVMVEKGFAASPTTPEGGDGEGNMPGGGSWQ